MTYFQPKEEDIIENSKNTLDKLTDKLDNWVDELIFHLPNFALAIVIFLLFILFANLSARLINKILSKANAWDSIRVVAVRIYKYVMVLLGFFIALSALDLSTALASILGTAGVVGIAVGLALQGTLSNTFSGVAISVMPKIEMGDWIRTNEYEGFVIDINLRNVTLKTVDQNLVCIPNNKILENPFKNLSTDPRSIAILECGVGYESDLEFVEKITIQAIQDVVPQEKNEKIEFFYKEFGSSSINYEVRFWIKELNAKDEMIAKHLAIKAIKKAYNENDINIPFPIRTLDFGKNKFRAETISLKSLDKD